MDFLESSDKIEKLRKNVDDDYFLRATKEDIIRFCEDVLNHEDDITENDIDNILIICKKYELNEIKAKAYMLRGLIYGKDNDFESAYFNFIRAISYIKGTTKSELKGRIYNNLGNCRLNQLDYEGAITNFKLALEQFQDPEIMSTTIICSITYNMALSYLHLEKYNEAIKNMKISLKYIDSKCELDKYIYRMVSIGICQDKLLKYTEAITTYTEIIDHIKYIHDCEDIDLNSIDERLDKKEKEALAIVYVNLSDVYEKTNQIDKAFEQYKESENIRKSINSNCLCHTQYLLARLYLKYGDNNSMPLALSVAKEALKGARISNDYKYIVKSYYIITDYYKVVKDYKNVIINLEELSDVFVQIKDYNKAILINKELISYYSQVGNKEEIKRCNEEIVEYLNYVENK